MTLSPNSPTRLEKYPHVTIGITTGERMRQFEVLRKNFKNISLDKLVKISEAGRYAVSQINTAHVVYNMFLKTKKV